MFLHRQLKEVEQWNRVADGLDLLAISYQIHSTGDNIIYSLTHPFLTVLLYWEMLQFGVLYVLMSHQSELSV